MAHITNMNRLSNLKLKGLLRAPYTRVVVPDEDGGFVAEILEFEGCFADGETPSEAFRNLDKVFRAWLISRLESGMPIPEPTGNAELSGRFALRLPKSLHYKAAVYAEREGVSLNTFINNSLAASVGMLDFVEKYATPRMDNFMWNQVQVILQFGGTYNSFQESTVGQLPMRTAQTLTP